jgi:DNA polymerase-3 subunit delta'
MSLTYSWDLIGHDSVLNSLEKDIEGGNLSHAYLFAGPDDIGKYAAGKRMAHILQCKDNFCGTCDICREIEKGYHADTIEMGNNGESIKIEKIREIIEKLNMTKVSKYKILLMQNIERMTPASSNALLKTLEDPPENVVFILTASRVKEILATILSRVRILKFRRLNDEDLKALLQKHYPMTDDSMVDTVCSFAQGRPGKALSLMENPDIYGAYRKMYEDIEMLLAKPDKAAQFSYVGQLAVDAKESEGEDLVGEFLEIFQAVIRKQMLMNVNGKSVIFPLEKCVGLLQNVQDTKQMLKRNINKRLLLENLMLNL